MLTVFNIRINGVWQVGAEYGKQLFMELATDEKQAAIFVNGIVPSEMAQAVAEQTIAPLA